MTVKLSGELSAVTLYQYGPDFRLQPFQAYLKNGEITLPVGDKLSIIRFRLPVSNQPTPPLLNPPQVRANSALGAAKRIADAK